MEAAIILGIGGFVCIMIAMGIALRLALRRPKLDEPLPDGTYCIHFVGYNKLTSAPMYEAKDVAEKED